MNITLKELHQRITELENKVRRLELKQEEDCPEGYEKVFTDDATSCYGCAFEEGSWRSNCPYLRISDSDAMPCTIQSFVLKRK